MKKSSGRKTLDSKGTVMEVNYIVFAEEVEGLELNVSHAGNLTVLAALYEPPRDPIQQLPEPVQQLPEHVQQLPEPVQQPPGPEPGPPTRISERIMLGVDVMPEKDRLVQNPDHYIM